MKKKEFHICDKVKNLKMERFSWLLLGFTQSQIISERERQESRRVRVKRSRCVGRTGEG
jgi:hypothetical protein